MRNVALKDLTWVARIEHGDHPDTTLHIAATDAPDMLTALSRVLVHVRDRWPYEVVSLEQRTNDSMERERDVI